MSDKDLVSELQVKVASLETETTALRLNINALAIAHMQHINILRGLMAANAMKDEIVVGTDKVGAFKAFGQLFDRVRQVLPWTAT